MPLELVIGNKNYSSWSLRPWLLLKHFGVEFDERKLLLDTPSFAQEIAQWSPAGRVPVLVDSTVTVWDSLAIAEYLNEAYLEGRGWPSSPHERAVARSLTAEMHAGFAALRSELPMNVRRAPSAVALSNAAIRDAKRVQEIWDQCLTRSRGPWLFGAFSIADAFFAPVALRFYTYKIALTPLSKSYRDRILVDPAVQEWCADAAAEAEVVSSDEI